MTALTEHFSWEELTATSHTDLQAANRSEAESHRNALLATARLMEQVRAILGGPIRVNSGFRGPSLNARVGGSKTSQHMDGAACDFVPGGDLETAFQRLCVEVRAGRLLVGQLLRERTWIHVSVGVPWRAKGRCGEIGRQQPDGSVRIIERIPAG